MTGVGSVRQVESMVDRCGQCVTGAVSNDRCEQYVTGVDNI